MEDCWYRGVNIPKKKLEYEDNLKKKLMNGQSFKQYNGISFLNEDTIENPERFFFFTKNGTTYVGTKTISDQVLENNLPGIFCSKIFYFNILGLLINFTCGKKEVRVAFNDISLEEKQGLFNSLTEQDEIFFPFIKLDKLGNETGSPKEGWFISKERAEYLGLGEKHIREYSIELIKNNFLSHNKLTVFDPACSTGQFLYEMKKNNRNLHTIGQDLSKQMIEFASDKVDELYCGDSFYPQIHEGTVDILFLRFLNYEVVTSEQARKILPKVLSTLKPKGTIVIFGHTPTFLNKLDLNIMNIKLSQSLAKKDNFIFQYYVGEKV